VVYKTAKPKRLWEGDVYPKARLSRMAGKVLNDRHPTSVCLPVGHDPDSR
jgi:hypothetical protein